MPLIGDLTAVPELTLAPEEEYELRCIKSQKAHSKNTGRNGVMLVWEFIDQDNFQNLIETLWFGNDGEYMGDDEDKSNLMWRMVQDKLEAFDMSRDGDIELEDFNMLEVNALVGIESSDEYPDKNVIKKIL